jgi:AcrR family transcriptional regulator
VPASQLVAAGFPTTVRGRRTRSALLAAGREVLEEVGYGPASIDLVSERAQVSHGTFYTYFDSKAALLREVARTVVGEMFVDTRVGDQAGLDAYSRIEAANRLYLAAWARNSRLLRVIEQAAVDDPAFRPLLLDMREDFVRRLEDGFTRLAAAGLITLDLPLRPTAIALGGMVEHFAHVWLDLGEDVEAEVAVRTLTQLWARAIGLARGEPDPP